ncbi:hypothetical protein BDV93DRAFT_515957 [Ceratobasidium sp. AG-I]|nr:hypothetical protein BDV93DRAFT_515957 [Ceratobasidium sp. AG-I]
MALPMNEARHNDESMGRGDRLEQLVPPTVLIDGDSENIGASAVGVESTRELMAIAVLNTLFLGVGRSAIFGVKETSQRRVLVGIEYGHDGIQHQGQYMWRRERE